MTCNFTFAQIDSQTFDTYLKKIDDCLSNQADSSCMVIYDSLILAAPNTDKKTTGHPFPKKSKDIVSHSRICEGGSITARSSAILD